MSGKIIELLGRSAMTIKEAREIRKKYKGRTFSPIGDAPYELIRAEGFLECAEKAGKLVEALKLKIGALQYDVWLHNSKLSIGAFLKGQRELVENAAKEMEAAHKFCEEQLAAWREVQG